MSRGAPHDASPKPPRAEASDRDLLARVASGDREALGPLFDRHAADVHRYVGRAAPRDDADDVVQETFLRLAQIAKSFDGRSPSARAFVIGVAHAIVRERRRALSRLARAVASFARVESDRVTAPKAGTLSDVDRAIARLSEEKRDVVLLTEALGMTGPEVAEALGVPVGTVWTRLHHARNELAAFAAKEPR